ncbi:MAG: hypothetical protein FH749_03260 [Firmicutes bacterium]|nr:hypothetical protein [Bacillota bacterium]
MKTYQYFAGANTASGFYSFYNFLSPDTTNRVFILKGGPGVGKSTMLKSLAKELGRFHPVDLYHCSADVGSLDGIFIHDAEVSVLDGTAPHTIDPRLPGAVQEIVDLGIAWNRENLITKRSEILNLADSISNSYSEAYRWLSLAAHWLNTARPIVASPASEQAAASTAREIIASLPSLPKGRSQKAFATAITSAGTVSYLAELAKETNDLYILSGTDRFFKTQVLETVAAHLSSQGAAVRYLYCGLQPGNIEHIYIPGVLGIFSSHPPHQLALPGAREFSAGAISDSMPKPVSDTIAKAVNYLVRAKDLHAKMEKIYVPNTDFTVVNAKQAEILEFINSLNI